MAPPRPRGVGKSSGRAYAWRSASLYAKACRAEARKRGGTTTRRCADEQGICHANPTKNVCLGGDSHREPASLFTACPLFRKRCDSFGRLSAASATASACGERTRYNRRRGRARGRHRGGLMSPDEAIALSLAVLSDLPRTGLTDRLRADDPNLLELARSLLPQATSVRATAARRGIRAIAWNEPAFPAALLTLTDLPPALWYRGQLDALTAPAVAIVGSRAASPVAIETATRIATDLASRGVTVVSGLARGVDSAAHRGALQTGRTAAVLGSGFDHMYPAEPEP